MKTLTQFGVALSLASLASYATADVYIKPGGVDDIGITTYIDYVNETPHTYKMTATCSGYGHTWKEEAFTSTLSAKGRIAIKQFPLDSSGKFPIHITMNGPQTYDQPAVQTKTGDLKGPSGFDCRPLYIGAWIKTAAFDIQYAGSGSNPSTYLVTAYPDNLNYSATQNYSDSQTISVSMTGSLSPDSGKSGISGSLGYSQTKLVGGSVTMQQMSVSRSNSGKAGNKWTYETMIDNNGHNIQTPYDIFLNGSDLTAVKRAIPNIALHFSPNLGQFWKIPKAADATFSFNFTAENVFAWGTEGWVWGYHLNPPQVDRGTPGWWTDTVYQQTVTLDTSHPAIAGLNAFRFRYGNTGQCLTSPPQSNLPTLFKMQDCSTQIAAQYYVQNADYTLSYPASGITDWTTTLGGPIRRNNGEIECASYDGRNCLWGYSSTQIDTARLKPLVCGDMHKQVWGDDGYSNPNHWCAQGRTQLQNKAANPTLQTNYKPEGQWFTDNDVYNGTNLIVVNGNIACYASDGRGCGYTRNLPSASDTSKMLICGADHKNKYGESGYTRSEHWCAKAAAKYLPASIAGESGSLYSKLSFNDDGTIKTRVGGYRVDAVNGKTIVRDVNTGNTRDGLWQYLVF